MRAGRLIAGGYGITEPIRYSPEFRVNHDKCMLRLYGNPSARGVLRV